MALGRRTVILEIGNEWMKVLEAGSSRGKVSISRMHFEALDGGSESAAEIFGRITREYDLPRARVIGCLPRQFVNVRTLDLPSTDPGEIADMVDFQAAKQTPYSKEEILFGYKRMASDRAGYTKIMLVIVQRSVLRQFFYIVDDAGVLLERMLISSEGIVNWYRHVIGEKGDGSIGNVVLDIDAQHSDFAVIAGGELVTTHCVRLGSGQLFADYGHAKARLVQEVKRLLDACRAESPDTKVDKVIVTGAGPRIGNLAGDLGSELGLAAEVVQEGQAARRMPKTPSVEDEAYRGLSLTPLLGIAMSPDDLEISLMPESVRQRRDLVTRALSLAATGMAVVGMVVCLSLFTMTKFLLKREHEGRLKARITEIAPEKRNVIRMHETVKAVRDYRNPRFAMVNLVSDVLSLTPPGVYMEGLDLDSGKNRRLVVSGTGESMKDVRALMNSLEGSPAFRDVREDGAMSKDAKTGRFKFKVNFAVEN